MPRKMGVDMEGSTRSEGDRRWDYCDSTSSGREGNARLLDWVRLLVLSPPTAPPFPYLPPSAPQVSGVFKKSVPTAF